MLPNAENFSVTAITVSELLRENQQGGRGNITMIRVKQVNALESSISESTPKHKHHSRGLRTRKELAKIKRPAHFNCSIEVTL